MIDLRPLYFFTQGAVADVRIVVTEMRLAKLSFCWSENNCFE